MRTFLLIFLVGYAVSSDDNYYVVRMPERETTQPKEFKVYWNVPTMQCKSKCIPFDDLLDKYGIIQNTNDTFVGNSISILYDPGNFPALIKDTTTGQLRYRNGGVPQEGDLMNHLQNFRNAIDKSIPDVNYRGIGIIDFESWRPILRQNFGSLTPYKDVSYDIERKRHWFWKKQRIEEEAKRRFDEAGRDFMKTTLNLVKKMRPNALWGYYGYPQCFNRPQNMWPEQCADDIPAENNRIPWLWSESTALYPSVYSTKDVTGDRLAAYIRGRIKESARVRTKGTPILPYWWYRYRDGEYFREADLKTSFNTFYNSNAGGFIIWGSSKDVNTKEKCIKLKKYVTDILGPMIAKYTSNRRKQNDEPIETGPEEFNPENVTEYDPDYQWVPPENYTSNIEQIVDEELKDNKTRVYIGGNVLIDIILNRIANFCLGDCERKDDVGLQSTAVLTTKNPFGETDLKTTALTPVYQDFLTTKNSELRAVTATTETTSCQTASESTDNIESNEDSLIGIDRRYGEDSYLDTNQNSIESSTKDTKDINNIQIQKAFDNAVTENYNISFEETSENNVEYDISSTTNNILETTNNIQETSLIFNTNIPDIDSNNSSLNTSDISTENINLNDISTTKMEFNNTSPANLDATDATPIPRPDFINWREFYLDLLNPKQSENENFDSKNEAIEVDTTATPELVDKVFMTFV